MPVRFDFVWFEASRRRDLDNVAAGGRKLALDSLVKAGVLQGDGWAHVTGWSDAFALRPSKPGVSITIHPECAAASLAP